MRCTIADNGYAVRTSIAVRLLLSGSWKAEGCGRVDPRQRPLYGKRFTIEETFRDAKDLRFGMGLSATHIRDAGRRDRLLLLAALAHALLTLLGAASEKTGMDAYLMVNTVKKRTHSLFRQGVYWYGAIPNMRDDCLANLMKAFDEIVSEHEIFAKVYALI